MTPYLAASNFPYRTQEERERLARSLAALLAEDWRGPPLRVLARWQHALAEDHQRRAWGTLFEKLEVLFRCGKPTPLSGPMIGATLCVRNTDWLAGAAHLLGEERSLLARTEWLAALWNGTFANTGLWMGKTFEPVTREVFAAKCGGDPATLAAFDPATARLGRNFFREAAHRGALQALGLPVLTRLWSLRDRPRDAGAPGFDGALLPENLERERLVPYVKTGGGFISHLAPSALAAMGGKQIYHLNYRWPRLEPAFPLTRLLDELVQVADGIWLGQLVMASHHFSLGAIELGGKRIEFGEAYRARPVEEYGYQHNGWFLMIDAALAREVYADDAFPELRPREGEAGWEELGGAGAGQKGAAAARPPRLSAERERRAASPADDADGWREVPELRRKFTTLCTEPSPQAGDGDPHDLLREGESVLQALHRIQGEIAAQARLDDHLRHFEALNRLFRSGVAPRVVDGLFQGQGRGFNTRYDAPERPFWYGVEEPCRGFDHYHGATLNLHWGIGDTLGARLGEALPAALRRRLDSGLLPSALVSLLEGDARGPAVLDAVWAILGRFVFPWGGKSLQRISGRKLSMLLDESADLERRYPARCAELRSHLASRPHWDLVRKNAARALGEGRWAGRLASGPWDDGMSGADREAWRQEALDRFVWGTNVEDRRILVADRLMGALDMNYAEPLPSVAALAAGGPTPFVRHGYAFLGQAGERSILPMNAGKQVFQFNYRYPMIGGPAPIGLCLDEIVEIAEGLFLGQLIYATLPWRPFHSSVEPAEYRYQLFGYFLLLDDDWQRHRRAIGLDLDT